MSDDASDSSQQDDFLKEASQAPPGFFAEFWEFLRYNKKWWLTPIFVVLLLVGILVLMTGSAAAPFIYTLF